MAKREPVLLAVLIENAVQRWYLAGIDDRSNVTPLVCSEPGNLSAYIGQEFDEQVSFLRHRLSGALQRGCDRLWGRNQKPALIVFAIDELFPHASTELTQRVADHFVEWMSNPPVVFLLKEDSQSGWQTLVGDWSDEQREVFNKAWDNFVAAQSQRDLWELIATSQ